MRIRIYNAKICSMEKDTDIFNGEIITSDGKIEYIGKENSNYENVDNSKKIDREINAKGNLIIPGFKNGHAHSGMTFLRSYADDLPLLEWLEKQVFPMEKKLEKGMVYTLTQLAILEYISGGTTAIFDMYFYLDEIAQASIDMGFRSVLCVAKYDLVSAKEDFKTFNNINPLVSALYGFHAEYTVDEEYLRNLSEFIDSEKESIHTHNSESKREVLECIERTGKTPTERMVDLGIYKHGGTAFHAVHLSDNDISLFKKHKINVITNPGSNVKLASGIPPITKLLENKINVGIGTDGPASNNGLDMFWEMRLTSTLQKINNNDASAMPADKVLEMACKSGAEIIGLKDSNCLAVGKNADLVMIDLNMPNMQPENHIVKNLVYAGNKSNVKMTMVGGRILYEDGEYKINIDPEEVYRKSNEIIEKLK